MTNQEPAAAAAEQFVVVDKKDADSTEQQEPSANDTTTNQADVTAAETTTTIEIPPEIFLKGLTVLSPRQTKSSSKNHQNDNDASTKAALVEVPLPPLRPEEPVASIRSAISEVIGFAHLTKYRLVLEERQTTTTANTSSSSSSTAAAARGGTNKKNGKKNLNGSSSQSGERNEWEVENVVSKYTLEGAQIAADKLVQSLKLGRAPEPTTTADANDKDGEELVLDDYGDLSPLLEVLEKEGKVGDPIDNKIIIDASNYAFRVVLERYDAASVRDHLIRVRQLLEGNAPHLVTLVGDEVVEVKKDEGVNGGDDKVSVILFQLLLYI